MTADHREPAVAPDAELLAALEVTTGALQRALKQQRLLVHALTSGVQFSDADRSQTLEQLEAKERDLERLVERLAQLKAL